MKGLTVLGASRSSCEGTVGLELHVCRGPLDNFPYPQAVADGERIFRGETGGEDISPNDDKSAGLDRTVGIKALLSA